MEGHLGQPLAESLDKALETVSETINKRQWPTAAQQAANTTHHWPLNIQAWKQRYLIALLLNDLTAATEYSTHLRSMPGFSNVDLGDMLRDQVLGIVRNHATDQYEAADTLLRQIKRLHEGDENREVCLLAVSGRLEEAQGNYEAALTNMLVADGWWRSMGKKANNQWRYNNWLHLQRLLLQPLARPRSSRKGRVVLWVAACYFGIRLATGLRGAKWTSKHAAIGLARLIPLLNRRVEHRMR